MSGQSAFVLISLPLFWYCLSFDLSFVLTSLPLFWSTCLCFDLLLTFFCFDLAFERASFPWFDLIAFVLISEGLHFCLIYLHLFWSLIRRLACLHTGIAKMESASCAIVHVEVLWWSFAFCQQSLICFVQALLWTGITLRIFSSCFGRLLFCLCYVYHLSILAWFRLSPILLAHF